MTSYRTRLNVLGLERREMPSATFAAPTPPAPGSGFTDGTLILRTAEPAAINGHVKVFDGTTGAEVRSFFAFEGFPGEAREGGDVNGDGRADVIVGATVTGHVKVFSGIGVHDVDPAAGTWYLRNSNSA